MTSAGFPTAGGPSAGGAVSGVGAAPRPPGPSLRLSLILIVAGLALAIPTFVVAIGPIIRDVTTYARFSAPNHVRVHLGAGSYLVYEDRGSTSIGSAFSNDDRVTITAEDVTVTSSEGKPVAVTAHSGVTDTINSGGDRFVGAVRFTTPAAGEYVVAVQSPTPKAVLIGRPFSDAVKAALGWLALAGLGTITVGVGIVLLIIGSVRRGRLRNEAAYLPAIPAGWHPDPGGSGRLRYWDGYRWTEHLQ